MKNSKKPWLLTAPLLIALAAFALIRGGEKEPVEAFYSDAGRDTQFALLGDRLVTLSDTHFALYSPDGTELISQSVELDSPTLRAGEKLAAAGDIGGTALYLAYEDGLRTVDNGESLISLSACGDKAAVCTTQAGYMGSVTVYASDGKPLFKWYSAHGIPLCAALSPDGERLAVICAADPGSTVHIFRLGSETELCSCSFKDELLFSLGWLSDDRVCALSEYGAYAVNMRGRKCADFSFDGQALAQYAYCDGGLALYLQPYETGGSGRLVILGEGLGEKGSAAVELVSLDARDGRILALTGSSALLYNEKAELVGTLDAGNAIRALLTKSGNAVLISRDRAIEIEF